MRLLCGDVADNSHGVLSWRRRDNTMSQLQLLTAQYGGELSTNKSMFFCGVVDVD